MGVQIYLMRTRIALSYLKGFNKNRKKNADKRFVFKIIPYVRLITDYTQNNCKQKSFFFSLIHEKFPNN